MPFPLSTTITAGQAGHAGLHAEERAALNELWEATARDTGVRDVSALLLNGWVLDTGGYVRVRRVGKTLTYSIRGLNGANAADGRVLAGLPGFEVAAAVIIIPELDSNAIGYGGVITEDGGMYSPPGTHFTAIRTNVVRATTESAWPTALPGAAV